jgi:dTDP-4-dehydrorhamnose reductase
MLGRMLRIRLAGDPAFSVEWTSRRENSGAHLFEADSSPSDALARIQGSGGFDYAVNCIALLKNAAAETGDPSAMEEATRINAEFPHMLAGLAAETGFKLLHVSTDAVFPPEGGCCSEADPPQPADFYGRTKLLGEPRSPHTLTIRCSIIGPNPVKKQGLFEWVAAQPTNATIQGYDDQLWNGVTTLQFANLCATIFRSSLFQQLRDESLVHHFCPNAAVTKYELVQLICRHFRPDVQVERASGGTMTRTLETRGMLRNILGTERPMDVAIQELSTYIDGPKAPDR